MLRFRVEGASFSTSVHHFPVEGASFSSRVLPLRFPVGHIPVPRTAFFFGQRQ